MKTKTLAPIALADEMLSTVAGGTRGPKHGCFPKHRGLGLGLRRPVELKEINVSVEITGDGNAVGVTINA